ncbi:putative membrane protein [Sinosporangium album]|uniref:Putative membrane protein n=1 Tax=Sinosporangium album TaxID=504805 RepID=A0A1G8BDV0_9ACTN|nr:PH domain-containing protein [Sinosporangium album]SDH31379.1 putative membrane protein [Sinosporangium album]
MTGERPAPGAPTPGDASAQGPSETRGSPDEERIPDRPQPDRPQPDRPQFDWPHLPGPEGIPGHEGPPEGWTGLPGPEGPPADWPPYAQVPPEPSRLSPLMILIDPVRNLPGLFVPLVGVLFVGGFSPASFRWAAIAIAGAVVFAVVRWFTFRYQVIGDRLELTRSLISRSVRTIPLDRIRGVDIATPPLHRLLGLVVLRIDTGASGTEQQEGELSGITKDEAERLKALLTQRTRQPGTSTAAPAARGPAAPATPTAPAPSAPAPEAASAPAEQVFLKVPGRWLRYGPLSGAYVLTPFAVMGAAVGLFFNSWRELGLDNGEGDAGLLRIARDAGLWVLDRPVVLTVVILLLLLAMPVAGGVMHFLFNWRFTLLTRGDHLVAERGLTTRRSVSLERRRVRGYEIVDAPLERVWKVARVWAIVAGLGDSQTRGQLLPAVPKAAALEVTAAAVTPFTARLRPHPPAALRRSLFRSIVPWLALAAAFGTVALTGGGWGWWAATVIASALALLGVPLGFDLYRSLGHAYDGVRISVRSGSLRRAQAVIERRAIVGWTIEQTWFQRRAGLLTVTAGVGAGSGGYAAIDVAETDGVAFTADVTPDWITPFLLPRDPD